MCLKRGTYLLFQVADYLVSVGTSVASARDVNPEIFAVYRLHNQLVKIAMGLNPIEPLTGSLEVGMAFVIVPGCVRGER